jgi:signal transduction histidine kinase
MEASWSARAAPGMIRGMAQPSDRSPPLSRGLWLATTALAVPGLILTAIGWGDMVPRDAYPNAATAIAAVVYASLGALIVRRTANVIGWFLQGIGLAFSVICLGSAYAVLGIVTFPGSLPAPEWAGAVAEWSFVASAPALALMMLFFPTGELLSPRWGWILGAGIVASGLTLVLSIVHATSIGVPAPGGAIRYPNPAGIESLTTFASTALVATVWIIVLVLAAAFVGLVLRYRKGNREVRAQIKWVALTAALAVLCNLVALAALAACGCDSSPVANAVLTLEGLIILLGLPAAFAIAILRYRLLDIDVLINRTVVYGLLATALTAVYVGVVVGVGTIIGRRGSSLLTIAAAAVVALLFQPLRTQAQRLSNRLVYGERATPYQVLSEFAERMAGTYGQEEVLPQMASTLALGTGATRVDVWLRVGESIRPAAVWPADAPQGTAMPLGEDASLPPFDGMTRSVPVRHGDELLGAITLQKPPNEPLSSTEDALVQDVASQAGLVLRNVRLTAELQASIDELRASRRRLVGAQDEERRKIERNLHDGAQQQLVALAVRLGLLERAAEDPDRVREMVRQLQEALRDALDDLRDLARGIYPPLLADKGLAAALEAQGRKAVVATTIQPDGIGRYPREIEAAVYFCTLEALQNVAKYAEATTAAVRLSERGGRLVFEIEDDGRGFDPEATSYGSGLQGMSDRLEAIGGSLAVQSGPGEGTVVRGEITLPR